MSGRQTESLDNEVPGIIAPDFRPRRDGGSKDVQGRERGVELAKRDCDRALGCYPGVYLIAPLLHSEATVDIAEFARGV
jgi:hypothetical protein